MNLGLPSVIIFGVGAILIYAAVKDVDPRDVVKQGLGGEKAQPINNPTVRQPSPAVVSV